jgi:hypothetical protein
VSLATRKFWLDGGYDRESVYGCPHHPNHRWWTFWLSDVLVPNAYGTDERMIICSACYVPRCGYADGSDPCLLPRHHETAHVYKSGRREPVGGYGSIA